MSIGMFIDTFHGKRKRTIELFILKVMIKNLYCCFYNKKTQSLAPTWCVCVCVCVCACVMGGGGISVSPEG